MIPLTILRLLVNGRPFLPSLDGRSGSTTAHCSSVKASNRVNSLTWPVSGKPNSTYRRHALAKDGLPEPLSLSEQSPLTFEGSAVLRRMKNQHTMFWIPMRWYGLVFLVASLSVAISSLF